MVLMGWLCSRGGGEEGEGKDEREEGEEKAEGGVGYGAREG